MQHPHIPGPGVLGRPRASQVDPTDHGGVFDDSLSPADTLSKFNQKLHGMIRAIFSNIAFATCYDSLEAEHTGRSSTSRSSRRARHPPSVRLAARAPRAAMHAPIPMHECGALCLRVVVTDRALVTDPRSDKP